MKKYTRTKAAILSATSWLAFTAITQPALSQEGEESEKKLQTVTVTGTNIKRSSFGDLASPIESIGQNELEASGAKDLRDIIDTLTINTGSQNNSDIFLAGYTTGTSNINLRGLGVASTLVLLNGKRQVVSSVPTTDGILFVDTASLIPNIAVDRLEILKDGASSIYGSEAVAGVANFITRDDFVGLEVSADYQARASSGDQEETTLQGIVGVEGDWGNLVAAVSYFDRTPLLGFEPDWLDSIDGTNTSGVGSPGTFIGVSPAVAAALGITQTGPFTPDPECTALGGLLAGVCRFDFHEQQTVVPTENRFQGYTRYTGVFNDWLSGYAELSFARNRAQRETSPSYPFILDNAIVSADAPFNIFGEEVRYFGRPLGTGQPSTTNFFENDTFRFSAGLSGEFSNGLFWDFSFTKGISDGLVVQSDTITDHFIEAVAGFGGVDCPVRSRDQADALGVTPGDNSVGCYYWNPFGSALRTTNPEFPNGQEVRDYIFGQQALDSRSELTVVDFVLSGETGIELGGGPIGAAIGAQYRDESLDHQYDTISNQDGFSFLVGNPDFSGSRDGWAIFGEVSLPFTDDLEVQGAIRYEQIDGLDTTDPKIGVRYNATDWATLRGSYSTSFRAPSTFQLIGTQTTFTQVSFNGATNFISARSNGNEDLKPETSTAYNIGGSFDLNGLMVEIDYTSFQFEDVLTSENVQAIIDRAVAAGTVATDPQIVLTSGGTVGQVIADFINANSIDTSVVDLSARYTFETSYGDITPFFDGTYVVSYDLTDVNGVEVDGAGSRNFRNFGDPTPELRFNTGVRFNSGNHSLNSFVRYVDGLTDDQNGGADVDEQITFDAQYSYTFEDLFGSQSTQFSVGVINVFDEDPPFVRTNGNFESRAHDPRGRRVYVRLKTSF